LGIAPGPSDVERTEFAVTLRSGETWVETVALTNLSEVDIVLDLYAADGQITDDGDPGIQDRYTQAADLGSWIGFNEQSVLVPPQSSLAVPFRVTVPLDAVPGDHCGGLVASLNRGEAGAGVGSAESNLVLDARTAVWLCVTVPGDVVSDLRIYDVRAVYHSGVGGLGAGRLEVTGTVVNEGTLRFAAEVATRLTGPFGWWDRAGDTLDLPGILPGQTQDFSTIVEGVPPWARLNWTVTLTPEKREGLPGASPCEAGGAAWAAPWIGVGFLMLLGLAIWRLATARRRHKRRIDRAVAVALAAKAGDEETKAEAKSPEAPESGEPVVGVKPSAMPDTDAPGER
jgi:hypothetical protein